MNSLTDILRNLFVQFRRFKLACTLNLAGLCIAFITFFVFFTKVEEEIKYNSCFNGYEHMFRIEIKGKIFREEPDSMANLFAPMRYIAKETPHVKAVGILMSIYPEISIINTKKSSKDNTYKCNYYNGYAEYLDFFGIAIIDSLPRHKDGDILVPQSFAKFMYNDIHISGKDLTYSFNGHTETHRIAGVYKDFPRNCSVKNGFYCYGKNEDADKYTNFVFNNYVLVDGNNNVEKIEKHILNKIRELNDQKKIDFTDISTVSIRLTNIHLAHFSELDKKEDTGNWTMTVMLFFAAILAIVLTNVNYINHTLAMAPMRIRNINTRRVLGASRASIMAKLIGESLLTTTIAFVISMGFLFVLNELISGNINPIYHLRILAYTFFLSIWTTIISSIYPAWYATSFVPSIAIKGTFGLTAASRRMRTIRVAFQIIVCIVTTTVISALFFQQRFIFHSDKYGYDTENVLIGTLQTSEAMLHKEDIRNEIKKIEGVESVSYSRFELGTDERYFCWSVRTTDKKYNFLATVLPVEKEYFKTLGLKMEEGDLDLCEKDSGAFVCNKAACEKFKWIKVNGNILPYDNYSVTRHKIKAICENIVFSSIREKNDEKPLLFYIPGKDDIYSNNLNIINIRISKEANVNEISTKIQGIYNKYSGSNSTGDRLNLRKNNESLIELYTVEMNFLIMMSSIAMIFMAITLIGVFCITLFDCEYRKKEIGIRKVFGATTAQIMKIFVHKYFRITLFCLVISLPFSYLIIHKLMLRFTLHSEFVIYAYPIAFAIVTLAVLGTVSIECYRAAKAKVENR